MADADAAPTDGDEAEEAPSGPEPIHGAPVTVDPRGQVVAHPTPDQLVDVVRALRDEGFLMCLDVTAVDHLANAAPRTLPEGMAPERFELVVVLIAHDEPRRILLKVQVPEADPVVPSLFEVHPGTEALEREVFDMFGIRFDGHPDLTRILMPEDWEGHPLRKDYAVGRIPVQFKGDPAPR
ncbi:NADH-quinone oxidoreductase subunit C [Iamia majanohamensis]|uniref:NADH-quinone oxidoreductase subunit C n=1 Tax=Iamia majanohamensis TaxID=467976 RepID=A0AAF0BV52_9ACTN|nr:NADH-quinone oxidoreductase subunit C [Iamia majanohamensis]WCO66728.1 NADH-quinone oxidoreductase subunit C [Iamia majanohamensis]